jgi:hypothetical protein
MKRYLVTSGGTHSNSYITGMIIEDFYISSSGNIENGKLANIPENQKFFEMGYSLDWRGNYLQNDEYKEYLDYILPESSLIKIPKRIDMKDKYKNELVICLEKNKKTIYLSNALRTKLCLKTNKIGFAFDSETKKYFIFNEFEEKEGWEITPKGNFESASDWRDLFDIYNTYILYVNKKYKQEIDHPDYLFYEITLEKNINEIQKKTYLHKSKLIEDESNYAKIKYEPSLIEKKDTRRKTDYSDKEYYFNKIDSIPMYNSSLAYDKMQGFVNEISNTNFLKIKKPVELLLDSTEGTQQEVPNTKTNI